MAESERQRLTLFRPCGIGAHLPQMSHLLSQAQQMRKRQLGLHYAETDGYFTLEAKYPHLLVQLEQLTFSWLLAGKHILTNKATLRYYLEAIRYQLPLVQKAPFSIMDEDLAAEGYTDLSIYQQQMARLLYLLETEILPILPDPPQRKEIPVYDGPENIDEFTGEESEDKAEASSIQSEAEGEV